MNYILAYNKLFQEPAKTTCKAIWLSNPEAEIYAVVSSDVDDFIDGVKYYVNDPQIECVIINNTTGKPYSNIVYNTVYCLEILPIKKGILLDIDQIVLKDMSELWNSPTGESGIAAIPLIKQSSSRTMRGMMQNWSNGYVIPAEHNDRQTFNPCSFLMDFEKMKKNKCFEFVEKFIREYHCSEMAAYNVYADDKWVRLDNKFGARSDFTTDLTSVVCLDYAGEHKPWTGRGRNVDVWNKYRDLI